MKSVQPRRNWGRPEGGVARTVGRGRFAAEPQMKPVARRALQNQERITRRTPMLPTRICTCLRLGRTSSFQNPCRCLR